MHVFGIVGSILPRRAGRPPRRQERGVRQHPSRAGRRFHGRRPRTGHRHTGRVPGDERTRRDEPHNQHRRGPRGPLARRGDRRRIRLGIHGRDAFQELDLVALFRPVTKLSIQVTGRSGSRTCLARVSHRDDAWSGVRIVDIPRDVLNDQVVRMEPLPPKAYRPTHPAPPHPEAVREAARLLGRAQRPLLIAGGGVTWAGATDLVARLCSARIARPHGLWSERRRPKRQPLYVGPLGRRAPPRPPRHAAGPTSCWSWALASGSSPASTTGATSSQERRSSRSTSTAGTWPRVSGRGRDPGRRGRDARRPPGRAAQEWSPRPPRPGKEDPGAARRQARLPGEPTLDAMPLKPQRVYAERDGRSRPARSSR